MKHAREDYDRFQDPAGLIPEDEPVFLIRAQDAVGAQAVEYWALRAEAIGASPEIVDKARNHALRMRQWQIDNGRQVPTLPGEPETRLP